MWKKILPVLLTVAMISLVGLARASSPCDRTGLEHCFSPQFMGIQHTTSTEQKVRSNISNSGKQMLEDLQRGKESWYGKPFQGTLFLWLKTEYAENSGWRIPANQMRELRFQRNGTSTAMPVRFITRPAEVPTLDDPRLEGLSTPHYVLDGTASTGGLGWSFPKELLPKLAYAVFCPGDGVTTSYPDRRGKNNKGLHFTPNDIRMWMERGWEYTLEPVLIMP